MSPGDTAMVAAEIADAFRVATYAGVGVGFCIALGSWWLSGLLGDAFRLYDAHRRIARRRRREAVRHG